MSSSRAPAVLLCSSLSLPSASSNFLFSAERVVRQLNQDAPEPTRKPSTEESNVFTMDLEEWNLCAAKRPAKEVPQSIDFLKHGWATSSFKLFEGLSMKVWRVWLTLLLSSSLISCVRGCVMPGMVCVSCVRVVCGLCVLRGALEALKLQATTSAPPGKYGTKLAAPKGLQPLN